MSDKKKQTQFGCRLSADRLAKIDQIKIKFGLSPEITAASLLDFLLDIATQFDTSPQPQPVGSDAQADNNHAQELKELRVSYSELETEAERLLTDNATKAEIVNNLTKQIDELRGKTFTKPDFSVMLTFDEFHYKFTQNVARLDFYRKTAKLENKTLQQVEREHLQTEITDTHIFDMLINRLFMPLQIYGIIDFDVVRVNKGIYNSIRSKYEQQKALENERE